MDPVSIFEDALKGLATKDFDADVEEPSSNLNASVNVADDHVKPGFNETFTNAGIKVISAPTITKPPNEVATTSQNDIILSALINAGIAPASLKPQETFSNPPSVSITANPNVKVLSSRGTTILRVMPSANGSSSPIAQAHSPLIASHLLKKPGDNSRMASPSLTHLPNIIRKRPPSLIETSQPISKVRRVASQSHMDGEVGGQTNSAFPSVSTVPTSLNNWYQTPNISRPSLPHNLRLPNHVQQTPRPYPVIKRDEDMDEDEDLAQAETYADYIPLKCKLTDLFNKCT
ncbi:unnamed protein product [Trichobilharzia regenti]|nr:unnamed protein product [Trichobilharzia regenti]